jgi:hypothetical protein
MVAADTPSFNASKKIHRAYMDTSNKGKEPHGSSIKNGGNSEAKKFNSTLKIAHKKPGLDTLMLAFYVGVMHFVP